MSDKVIAKLRLTISDEKRFAMFERTESLPFIPTAETHFIVKELRDFPLLGSGSGWRDEVAAVPARVLWEIGASYVVELPCREVEAEDFERAVNNLLNSHWNHVADGGSDIPY